MPHGPQRTVAHRVVIRIEEIAERTVERFIPRQVFGKKKCLEEPGGVRQMPLRRTRIRHRLQAVVLYAQWLATSQRGLTNRAVSLQQARFACCQCRACSSQ